MKVVISPTSMLLSAFLLVLSVISSAHGAEFSDAFVANRHPICGSNSYSYRLQAANQNGRPAKIITYEMQAPKVCRHLMFGLIGTYEKTQSGIRVSIPGMPDEYRIAVEFINEIGARHVFNGPALSEYGVPLCADDPNFPGVQSAECIAAIAQLQRNDLLRVPRVSALEILDRFLGSANYKDPAIIARLQSALAIVKSIQADMKPQDVVKLLGLSGREAEITLPRLEEFPTFFGNFTQKLTVKLTSPDPYTIRFEGTALIFLDSNAKAVAIRIDQGRVFWDPSGQISSGNLPLNGISLDWCSRPADADKGNFTSSSRQTFWFPLLGGLAEQISPDREIRLDGLTAALPLPPNDVRLENHWLCMQMWNQNAQSLAYAHGQDAMAKGCKGNCL
jgi:hypothetical protein